MVEYVYAYLRASSCTACAVCSFSLSYGLSILLVLSSAFCVHANRAYCMDPCAMPAAKAKKRRGKHHHTCISMCAFLRAQRWCSSSAVAAVTVCSQGPLCPPQGWSGLGFCTTRSVYITLQDSCTDCKSIYGCVRDRQLATCTHPPPPHHGCSCKCAFVKVHASPVSVESGVCTAVCASLQP